MTIPLMDLGHEKDSQKKSCYKISLNMFTIPRNWKNINHNN